MTGQQQQAQQTQQTQAPTGQQTQQTEQTQAQQQTQAEPSAGNAQQATQTPPTQPPAGQDDQQQGQVGAKGEPSREQQMQRIANAAAAAAVEQALAQLGTQVSTVAPDDSQGQQETSELAQLRTQMADQAKAFAVERALLMANCIDTAGAMAHITMADIKTAEDGALDGFDEDKLKADYPHLFAAQTTPTVSTGASPKGKPAANQQVMTVREALKERNKQGD